MSNENRKVLAVSAGAAMVLSSFVGLAPAGATEPNNVDLAPTTGANYGTFVTDEISIDMDAPGLMNSAVVDANFAILIQNPDGTSLDVGFGGVDAAGYEFAVTYVNALGDAGTASFATAVSGVAGRTALNFPTTGGEDAVAVILSNFRNDDGSTADAPSAIKIHSTSATADPFAITLQAWVDGNADVSDIEASTASATETINFYNPVTTSPIVKLRRDKDSGGTVRLNEFGQTGIFGALDFSRPVNLDQVDLSLWQFAVEETDAVGDATINTDVSVTADTVRSYDDFDDAGEILIEFPASGGTLRADVNYQVKTISEGTDARTYNSNRFEVVTASSDQHDGIDLDVTETANAVDGGSNTVDVRAGTESVTYTTQLTTGAADREEANQPVVVVVTATEGTISLSGSADGVMDENTAIFNTTTDSDGQVEFTVTSSALEGDSYTVDAYAIDSTGATNAATRLTATYDASNVTEVDTDADVYTGENVQIVVDLVDQFEEAIDVSGTDTVYVTARATDTDDLDETLAFSGGEATFTFANYLSTGESDIITIDIHTGADADDTISDLSSVTGDQLTVTLYAATEATGLTVNSDEVDTIVGYTPFSNDPILDGGDPSLHSSNDGVISGTVIDSTGAGIPGAQVTLTAAGVQFANDPTFTSNLTTAGTFAVDTITVTATESGTFSVNAWSHVADDVDVTVTSGGQSATVTLAGSLPTTLEAGDLTMSWNLPSDVVVNTTYAVTATVTDVWGNPIDETLELTFTGEAAAEFNSVTSVTKATNSSGSATVYLRSLDDVTGLAAVSVEVSGDSVRTINELTSTSIDDDENTPWDESAWNDQISEEINFLTTAPASSDTKVNAGSFKGYVAVYAKGYEGQRLSAKIGNDWVVVPALASSFERIVDFTGAGVDIAVRIYIDRVLMDTINLTTK